MNQIMSIAQVTIPKWPEWMDLKTVQRYVCVSDRTLREWIHQIVNPLPATQVSGGKVLVCKSKLDTWLVSHPFCGVEILDVNGVAKEIIAQFKRAA
jgi:excisionase family DNA binding protein